MNQSQSSFFQGDINIKLHALNSWIRLNVTIPFYFSLGSPVSGRLKIWLQFNVWSDQSTYHAVIFLNMWNMDQSKS